MDEDYEEWSISELRERVELVQELDGLADDLVSQAIQVANEYEKIKKQRTTALENLQLVINSFRRPFQSFVPTAPESYRDTVSKMITTVLPVWLQYRFTYIPF